MRFLPSLLLVLALSPAAQAAEPPPDTFRLLERASAIDPEIRFDRGFPRDVRVDVATSAAEPVDQAFEYLTEFRAVYGLADPPGELVVDRVRGDRRLASVRLRQIAGGLPVQGGELLVTLRDGRVISTRGHLHRVTTPPAAALTREDAEAMATREGLILGRSELQIRVDADGTARQVWRVAVAEDAGMYTRSIDAITGKIVAETGEDTEAKDIIVQTAQNTNSSNCWDWAWEGQDTTWFEEAGSTNQYDPSADVFDDGLDAWNAGHDLYHWLDSEFLRDSYNAGGAQLNFMVHVGLPNPNASWIAGCGHMVYSDGWMQADIAAHEITHAIDSSEGNLEYKNQSGALDESFADVFAALFEPDAGWLGEDLEPSVGNATCPAIRSMFDPTLCGQPDHYDNFKSITNNNGNPDCNRANATWNDCGWVHTNSGITNKAAWLLMEGGMHNGYIIDPIGRYKVGQLYYHVLATQLTSDSDFVDARHALVWSAEDFADVGFFGFTDTDVCNVRNAFASVGIVPGGGDSDCDGYLDVQEEDDDHDYTEDENDNCPNEWNPTQYDDDGDGLGDECDPDSDGDGVLNGADNCSSTPNASQKDVDNDGIGDVCDDGDYDGTIDGDDNCPADANGDQKDLDGDGYGDVCDNDDDGDGVNDTKDVCPQTADDQSDIDGDGVGDVCDNCVEVENPDQRDCDGDGIGQACEPPLDPDNIGLGCSDVFPVLEHVWVHPLDMVALPVCEDCSPILPQDWAVDVYARTSDGTPLRVVDDRGFQVGLIGREGLTFEPVTSARAEVGREVVSLRSYFIEVSPEANVDGVEMELTMQGGVR